jgi:hypothetical protein
MTDRASELTPAERQVLLEAAALEGLEWVRAKERRVVPRAALNFAKRALRLQRCGWRWDRTTAVEDFFNAAFWREVVAQRFGGLAAAGALSPQAYLELVDLVVRTMREEIETELRRGRPTAGVDAARLLSERLEGPHPAIAAVIAHLGRGGGPNGSGSAPLAPGGRDE